MPVRAWVGVESIYINHIPAMLQLFHPRDHEDWSRLKLFCERYQISSGVKMNR